MKSFIVATLLLAASALAQTPPITITQPLTAFNWTTCQPQVIAWVNPTTPTITEIWLATGSTTALQKVLLVANNVPTAPGTFTWTPPSTITTGQYSLEFGSAPNIAYAGPFTITQGGSCAASPAAGGGAPASAPASSDSAAPSSSAAAGSSSPAAASSSAAASSAGSGSSPTSAAGSSSASSSPAPAPTSSKSGASGSAPAFAALAMIPLLAVALF